MRTKSAGIPMYKALLVRTPFTPKNNLLVDTGLNPGRNFVVACQGRKIVRRFAETFSSTGDQANLGLSA